MMQKYLVVSLCVLATFVLTESKPWCGEYGCINEEYGGAQEYGQDVLYGMDIFPYRADNGYPNNHGHDHFGYGSQRKVQYDAIVGGKNGLGGGQNGFDDWQNGYGMWQNGYDDEKNGYGNGQNGYDDVQNGYGNGQSGFDDGQNGYDDGQKRHDDGQNGYGDEQYGFGSGLRGRRPPKPNSNYGAKITTFGNGIGNRNTFNLAKRI